jgi:hypothetical protein
MNSVIVFLLGLLISIPVILGIDWVLWKGYLWIASELWPTAATNLVSPSYWLFVAVLLVGGAIIRALTGGGSSK